MKPHLSCLLALALATSVQGAWQRVPQSGPRNVDVLTSSAPLSVIEHDKGIRNPELFFQDDSTVAVNLPRGKSHIVVGVPSVTSFSSVRFTNDDAAGVVRVYQSSNGSQWDILGETGFTSSDRLVEFSTPGAQSSQLKIEFDLSVAGSVRCAAISASSIKSSEFDLVAKGAKESGIGAPEVDLADGLGLARVIYVNPTPDNYGTASFKETVLKFPASSSNYRTVVYDLGQSVDLSKFGAAYSNVPVHVAVYALNSLPETKDWRGKPVLNPTGFTSGEPVVSHTDKNGEGCFSAVPTRAVRARYVVFQFNMNAPVASTLEESVQKLVASVFGHQAPKKVAANDGGFTVGGIDIVTGSVTVRPFSPNLVFTPAQLQDLARNPLGMHSYALGGAGGDDNDGATDRSRENPWTGDPELYRGAFANYSFAGYRTQLSGGIGNYYSRLLDEEDDNNDDDKDDGPNIPPTSP